MPSYRFLAETPLKYDNIAEKLKTLRIVGVPYTDEEVAQAKADLEAQATPGADTDALMKRYPKANLVPGNGHEVTELDALVAYLQVLGTMVDFTDPSAENPQQ